ncbi:repeat-containing protein A_04 [Orientia tsutsugamushi str. Ikeda]|uniref:Repeat-containing protein A_04 n=2 Tax=Orientia tsutsugamushi (strain Ikeda) TaxID=334380 RepID=B3CSE4_ORITI|nr:RAP domain-containing protein [Orientia tsutsugamushi]BAG40345.1 repeat-containing protein A_04 [Orientia tsutsugamushi str. Ikeda]
MHRGSSTQFNIQAMGSIQLCKMLKDRDVLSKPIITEIYNRALFLLQTEDARYNRVQFDARGLATILYQFAKLNYVIGSEFIEAWTNKAINLMDEFNPQELANSIWAFGRLEIHPSDQFIQAWIHHATKTIDNFNTQGLANSIWAFGRLEIHPSDQFIQAWIHHATKTIDNFNTQGLANSILALGQLEIHPSDQFIQAWIHHATKTIDNFNTQNLANSIWAFGQLEIHPSDQFIQAWIHHATKTIDNFNTQNLANSIWAFGQLEIHPSDQFIQAWIHHATKTIDNFSLQELANSIYGIFTLNVLCNSKIKVPQQFISAVNQNIELFDENIEDIGQILKAHYYFGKQGVGILTSQNRQLLEKKFKTKLTPCHTSNLQLNVLKVVKKVLAQHTVKSEYHIKQITSSVDIFIKEKNTVIQVDGPSHFDDNNAPNFSTRLNTELLKSYGYIVHRIPYWVWNKLKTNIAKEEYICELICTDEFVYQSETLEEVFYDAQENIPEQSTSEILPHSESQVSDDVFYDAYEYIPQDLLTHESSFHYDMQALGNIGSSDFETHSL